MSNNLEKVEIFLNELGLSISSKNEKEELVIVDDEEKGISNLIIDCEEPILVIEQVIMEVPKNNSDFFKRLLQINRTMVHGAFALNETGNTIFFRDTLQLENLDKNELEGSINSLSLALAENAEELINFSKS